MFGIEREPKTNNVSPEWVKRCLWPTHTHTHTLDVLVALGTPGSVISYRGLIAKDLIFTWVTFLSQPLRFMPPTHPRSYAKSLQVKDQSVTLSAPLPLMFVD